MRKKIILSGLILFLITYGFCGCIDDGISAETISISGIGVTQTVNKPNKSIRLDVSGTDNDVTVTKETNLIEVDLSGIDNIVRVSRSHSFDSDVSGIRTEIVYYD